jgi:hypothetical protein
MGGFRDAHTCLRSSLFLFGQDIISALSCFGIVMAKVTKREDIEYVESVFWKRWKEADDDHQPTSHLRDKIPSRMLFNQTALEKLLNPSSVIHSRYFRNICDALMRISRTR